MAEAEEAAQNAERELHMGHVIEAEWSRSDIPPLLRDSTLDNFIRRPGTERALRLAERYVDNFDPRGREDGLFFFGPPGAGKSRLAVAVARAVMESYLIPVRFITAADLVYDARQHRFGSTEQNPIDKAAEARLLILDDLANQNVTADAQEKVYLVIDRRYRAGAPTIITSNLSDAQLRKAVGEALVSRMLEVYKGAEFTATDYREEIRRTAQRR